MVDIQNHLITKHHHLAFTHRKDIILKPYQPVVVAILNQLHPATILDAPSGSGWLKGLLSFDAKLDGLDLFAPPP